MAIKLNDGTVLRNLEEQVQYLTSYHDVNQGLAQWGIRVVGTVASASQLPDPSHYDGEYGDTYAVGTSAPYDFYIWTRSPMVGGLPYWFNFGEISIVGPQGPRGPQGPAGTPGRSTHFYASGSIQDANYFEVGDLFLTTVDPLGSIYEVVGTNGSKSWKYIGNIRGPQGVQGIQGPPGADGKDGEQGPPGPQGDVGGFINIWGILTNSGQLPTPASLNNLTVAYLVEHTGGNDAANDHYDLYIQVGETSDAAIWTNAGPFNAATLVTANGVGLNVWNADTKVDKITDTYTRRRVYGIDTNGSQLTLGVGYSNDAIGQTIAIRDTYGSIYVPDSSIGKTYNFAAGQEAVNRKYVDDKFVAKKTVTAEQILTLKPSGTTDSLSYNISAAQWNIVRRDGNAQIEVVEVPTAPNHAASKAYVDAVAGSGGGSGGGTQLYKHVIEVGEDTMGDGSSIIWDEVFTIISNRPSPYDLGTLQRKNEVMPNIVRITYNGYIVPEYEAFSDYIFLYYIQSGMITDTSKWYTEGNFRDTVTPY